MPMIHAAPRRSQMAFAQRFGLPLKALLRQSTASMPKKIKNKSSRAYSGTFTPFFAIDSVLSRDFVLNHSEKDEAYCPEEEIPEDRANNPDRTEIFADSFDAEPCDPDSDQGKGCEDETFSWLFFDISRTPDGAQNGEVEERDGAESSSRKRR